MKVKASRRRFIWQLAGSSLLLAAGSLNSPANDRTMETRVIPFEEKKIGDACIAGYRIYSIAMPFMECFN